MRRFCALLPLVVGSGRLNGSISSQLGALYPLDAVSARTQGFTFFAVGINAGTVLSPLPYGVMAQRYDGHYGSGIAAIFMLLRLGTYPRGYRYLPARVGREQRAPQPLTPRDWRVICTLLGTIGITIFYSIAFCRSYNVNSTWSEQHVDLRLAGHEMSVPWVQSVNAICRIVAAPPLVWLWRRAARQRRETADIAKIGMRGWLTVASNLLPARGSRLPGADASGSSGRARAPSNLASAGSRTGPCRSR
jgi:POT family proton-dependent oligopeptide transporter